MCYSMFYRREKATDGHKDVASPVTEKSAPVTATTESSPKPGGKEDRKRRAEEVLTEEIPA